jgi:hypothetical protein
MNPARPAPRRGRPPWTLRMPHPVAVRDAGAACLAKGPQWPQGGAGCMAAPAHGAENGHRVGTLAQGALAARPAFRRGARSGAGTRRGTGGAHCAAPVVGRSVIRRGEFGHWRYVLAMKVSDLVKTLDDLAAMAAAT